mgnify:CR=1 FL=1
MTQKFKLIVSKVLKFGFLWTDSSNVRQCQTDDDFMIHDFIKKTNNSIQYFLIPKKSTSDGSLELRWIQDKTDIMRGVSVSEIWLIKS